MKKTKYLPGERAAQIGVFALLSLFPLFITEKYSNITASKYFFFTFAASLFLAICLINKVKSFDFIKGKIIDKNKELSETDLFFLLFVLVAAVSTFSSRFKLASLGGGGGRRMGLLMILATFFAYIFISKFYRTRSREFYFFGITVMISCLYGFMQFLGFDPLNLLANLSRFYYLRFISFSGNINVHASFICIGLPFAMYMFCHTDKRKELYFWLAVAICGIIGLLTCNSDSGYLGIFVAFVALAIVSAKKRDSFIRFLILVATFFATCGFFLTMQKCFEEQSRHITFLGRIITHPAILCTAFSVALLLAICLHHYVLDEKYYKRIQKALIILTGIFVAAIVSAVFIFTAIDKETDLGQFNFYLRFNDKWGTDRGYVWTRMMRIFRDFPLYRKLIGSGPDTAAFELLERYAYEMRHEVNCYFDNAHNDIIQYLITIGLLGVITYIGLFATCIKTGFKSDSLYSQASVFPVIAFFVQALVNINQPITTPLIFVFMALCCCKKYEG